MDSVNFEQVLAEAFPQNQKINVVVGKSCDKQLALEILVISDEFEGKKLLECHQYFF